MRALKNANLGLRFCLELAMLGAFAVSGYVLGGRGLKGAALAFSAAAGVAAAWGLFVSPKARIKVAPSLQLVLELSLFALAGAGLVAVGHQVWGIALLVVAAASRSLKAWFDYSDSTPPAA